MIRLSIFLCAVWMLGGCNAAQLQAQTDDLQQALDQTTLDLQSLRNELNKLPADDPGVAELQDRVDEAETWVAEIAPVVDRLAADADAAMTDEQATVGLAIGLGEILAGSLGLGGVGLALGQWLRGRREPR